MLISSLPDPQPYQGREWRSWQFFYRFTLIRAQLVSQLIRVQLVLFD